MIALAPHTIATSRDAGPGAGFPSLPRTGPRRVGVVSCSGPKLDRRAPARDLYTSPLFRLARAFVEATCDTWVILSALHRVVEPGQLLAPYEQELAKVSKDHRRIWAVDVEHTLRARYPGAHFVVLAGSLYVPPFAQLSHELPLRGLQIGERLRWLKRQVVELERRATA